MSKHNKNRVMFLVISIITFIFLGLFYAWSLFIAPIESAFGWTRLETSTTFTISMFGFGGGIAVNAWVSSKHSPRFSAIIGGVMILAGFIMCGLTQTLLMLYIGYGAIAATGIGLAYGTWLSMTMKWFPDKQGLAAGLGLMGFGFGSLLLGSAATAMMYSSIGWRTTFFILGALLCLELVVSSVVLKEPDLDGLLISGKKKSNVGTGLSLTTKQMLKDPGYWVNIIWRVLLGGFIGVVIMGQAASIGQEHGMSVSLSTVMVGFVSVGNGVGRLLIGFYTDRFGNVKATILQSAVIIFVCALILSALLLSNQAIMFAAMLSYGLVHGAQMATRNTYISEIYGVKHFASNLAICTVITFPMPLMGQLGSLMRTNSGSYVSFAWACLIVSLIAMVIALFTPKLIKNLKNKYAAEVKMPEVER